MSKTRTFVGCIIRNVTPMFAGSLDLNATTFPSETFRCKTIWNKIWLYLQQIALLFRIYLHDPCGYFLDELYQKIIAILLFLG